MQSRQISSNLCNNPNIRKDPFSKYETQTSELVTEPQVQNHDVNHDTHSQSQNEHQSKPINEVKKKKKKNSVVVNAQPIATQTISQLPKQNPAQNPPQPKKQPQVVRHRIYEIKKNLFPSETSLLTSSSSTTQEQASKKEDLNQNQMKAISSMFGQFFKVENLKNYKKNATPVQSQPKPVQRQIRKISKVIVQPATIQQSKIQEATKQTSETSNSITMSTFSQVHLPDSLQRPTPSVQNSNFTQIVKKQPQISTQSQQKQSSYLPIEQTQPQIKVTQQNLTTLSEQQPYKEPQFVFLNRQLTETPLVQDQTPDTIQLNHSDLEMNPFIQNSSRDSFPLLEEGRSTFGQDKSPQRKEITKNQPECAAKPIVSLRTLLNPGKEHSIQSYYEDQAANTPFFQIQQKKPYDESQSNQYFKDTGRIVDQSYEFHNNPPKNLHKIASLAQNLNQIQSDTLSSHISEPSQKIVSSSSLKPSRTFLQPSSSGQTQSNGPSMSQIYPKRLNSFMNVETEMSHIEAIFKDFNRENRMMIDPLSYNANFQTLETVSSNLVNQMDKDEQDRYISQLVTTLSQEWKDRMILPKFKVDRQENSSSQINLLKINQPKPTQSSSPSKYSSYLHYEEVHNDHFVEKQDEQLMVSNKSPLRIPTFSHNGLINPIQFQHEINEMGHSYIDAKDTSHKKSSSKLKDIKSSSSKKILLSKDQSNEQLPQSTNQPRDYRKNSQQMQQIRQFYNYLKSRQPSYKVFPSENQSASDSNSISKGHIQTSKPHQDIVIQEDQFHSLHQMNNTSKPIISHPPSHYSNARRQNLNSFNIINEHHPATFNPTFTNFSNTVLTFRQNNIGNESNQIKNENRSERDSKKHSIEIHEGNNHELISIEKQTISQHNQSMHDHNININSPQKRPIPPNFVFPIDKIQPIRITSTGKKDKQKSHSKSNNKQQKAHPSARKLKLITTSIPLNSSQQQNTKSTQNPLKFPFQNFIKPTQMNTFLLGSSHIGSMMLNNVISSYIQTHPVETQSKPAQTKAQTKGIQLKTMENANQSSAKKKISIKKNPGSNSKKLSINQQINTMNKSKDQLPLSSLISSQLKQTISRINQKQQNELHNMIKSRITQKSKSSSYYNSPNKNQNIRQSSFQQFQSVQIKSSTKKNQGKSRSIERSVGKRSRNSSVSSKKSGIQLWNQGLSELKSSRRQNGSKLTSIFPQKSQRQDQKIVGLTRWNQNLSKFKQSRSKSRQSRSSINSQTKENQKIIANSQTRSQNVNVQIKKHKYQVNNVLKRYL